MSIEDELMERAEAKCELCAAADNLTVYAVAPGEGDSADECALLCQACIEQIGDADKTDVHHWRCLNDSMWSQVPVVQVLAWRMLTRLRDQGWPQDLLDMLYLDDATLSWAQAMGESEIDEDTVRHVDSNGAVLEAGDTVILTKDLNVKGAGFTAKRGTPVRNISLVADNPEHIEGRVNGQQIVILTRFVKKSG